MKRSISMAILAMATLFSFVRAASGQATQPAANDRLIWLKAGGGYTEFKPKDGRWEIRNREPEEITVRYKGDGSGEWVAAGNPSTQPSTTQPAEAGGSPPLAEPSPPPVVIKPEGIHVDRGESWVAAVKRARPGDTVWLAAGGVWDEQADDTSLRLDRVSLRAYGDGPQPTIRVPSGSALVMLYPKDVLIEGVRFESLRPSAPGVRIFAGSRVKFVSCVMTGFTFGLTVEKWSKDRSDNISLERCVLSDNWNERNEDSSGFFASGVDGFSLDHCDVSRNGWKEGRTKGSIRCHGGYTAGDCTGASYTNCRFEANSSHGLQARAGGIVYGCVFVDNPIGLSFGLVNGGGPITEGGVAGKIENCVFVGERLLAGKQRGWAIEIGNTLNATISGCTFANDAAPNTTAVQAAIKIDLCNLSPGHPQAGKQIKVGKLVIDNNRGVWPTKMISVGAKCDELRVQQDWPAVDVKKIRDSVKRS